MRRWKAAGLTVLASALLAVNAEAHTYGTIYEPIYESMDTSASLALAQVVELEAGQESEAGKRAVVEVIMNRVLSPDFPNDVVSVLSQRIDGHAQFSTWRYREKALPSVDTWAAIQLVLEEGATILPSLDYVFFATKKHGWSRDHIKIDHQWFGRSK